MVKKNRMQKITAKTKFSHSTPHEKTPIRVAAGVALASTLAIATPAFAATTTKTANTGKQNAIEETAQAAKQNAVQNSTNNNPNATSKGASSSTAKQARAQKSASAADGTTPTLSETMPASAQAQAVTARIETPSSSGTASTTSTNGANTNSATNSNSTTNSTPAASTNSTPAPNPSSKKDTTNQQVVKPNTENPEAADQNTANNQVTPQDERKTIYNFTVHYAISGNQTKQLLQPPEFSFTQAELDKISANGADGVYIPVPTTKGYRAPRGNYVKDEQGKYVIDNEQNGSVQTYIKIDKDLINKYKNTRLSKGDTVVSEYTLEYNPKQVTFYVRHMLQNPKYDPCLLYTSPSPRDRQKSRMPSSA